MRARAARLRFGARYNARWARHNAAVVAAPVLGWLRKPVGRPLSRGGLIVWAVLWALVSAPVTEPWIDRNAYAVAWVIVWILVIWIGLSLAATTTVVVVAWWLRRRQR